MQSHAGVGHNAHGGHSHSGHHNHHNQHHSHLSPYPLNMSNSNIMASSEGGMFNEREVHSMLESAVKGKDEERYYIRLIYYVYTENTIITIIRQGSLFNAKHFCIFRQYVKYGFVLCRRKCIAKWLEWKFFSHLPSTSNMSYGWSCGIYGWRYHITIMLTKYRFAFYYCAFLESIIVALIVELAT